MPTVHVPVKIFNESLGKTLTLEQLEELCFEFGIEVELIIENESTEKEVRKYAFETPSNRYDLLCTEGIVKNLAIFLGLVPTPNYTALKGSEKMVVKKDVMISIIFFIYLLGFFLNIKTELIRPFVVAAILRDVKFNQDTYESFIDFQDKLHQNICRKRTLVAIGTHDYDTLKGPFLYDARKPQDINFIPLNKTESFDGVKLMEVFQVKIGFL